MKLGLVIDLDTCVGCHACATACKQWNTSGTIGPLSDQNPYGKNPDGAWLNRVRTYEVKEQQSTHKAPPVKPAGAPMAHKFDLFALATQGESALTVAGINSATGAPASKTVHMPMSCMQCEDADCVTVCPTGASYKREEDGIVLIDQDKCMGCNLCSWACPYGARELDEEQGVMKKCTLCVDRIYDQNLPESERQPACVLSCPTSSRIFGDFDDPTSEVSRLTVERAGQALMPELGYKPTNRYLPPREKGEMPMMAKTNQPALSKLKQWANRVIAR
ncbi:MAG: Fe-S-cluster-containing dehydrogenase component [Arenicella sp.]|jgi:Fe-S-cluster-containing dehydrogenase component